MVDDIVNHTINFDKGHSVQSVKYLELADSTSDIEVDAEYDYDLVDILRGRGTLSWEGHEENVERGNVIRVQGPPRYQLRAGGPSGIMAAIYGIQVLAGEKLTES